MNINLFEGQAAFKTAREGTTVAIADLGKYPTRAEQLGITQAV